VVLMDLAARAEFYIGRSLSSPTSHAIITNVTEDPLLALPDSLSFTYWTFPGHDLPEWMQFGPHEQLEIEMMRDEWWKVQEAIGRA
jgi:hypothetical protein